ncbi:MAG TPA: sulfurtransferase TusA family protein [Azospirillaceae bacterium]|nr:sulfurtransferase TusA family protein [Azospirillaceae bacterium]
MSRHLDAKGLVCPLPVLRAARLLRAMAAGELLEVEATDPASARDFPAFCAQVGHRLLAAEVHGGVYRFRIEKTG